HKAACLVHRVVEVQFPGLWRLAPPWPGTPQRQICFCRRSACLYSSRRERRLSERRNRFLIGICFCSRPSHLRLRGLQRGGFPRPRSRLANPPPPLRPSATKRYPCWQLGAHWFLGPHTFLTKGQGILLP